MSVFAGRIRPLMAEDRAAWTELWAGYLDFYRATLPAETNDAAFKRLTGPDTDMFGLVAEQDGRAIGIAHCVVHASTWSVEPYVYLNDLFVAPDRRGTGAARALIEAVYTRADAMGASRVYWLTHETNVGARKLYDTLAVNDGFLEYRR